MPVAFGYHQFVSAFGIHERIQALSKIVGIPAKTIRVVRRRVVKVKVKVIVIVAAHFANVPCGNALVQAQLRQ